METNGFKGFVTRHWYKLIVAAAILMELVVFLFYGEESYIQIHDNLDLFIPHFRMMELNDAWFKHGVTLPMLHGINRDLLGSEFLLYNVLYEIFEPFTAYITGYFLKLIIGTGSFILLFRDVYREEYKDNRMAPPIIWLVGFSYSLIPVFPTYGIAFTSIPLIVLLIRRLYFATDKKTIALLLTGIFLYPILSYFSYFGFFILCLYALFILFIMIRDRKLHLRMILGAATLSVGYIVFEYRLFASMLLDDTVTIRSTMERADLSLSEALLSGLRELTGASFHNQDSHGILIIFIAAIGLIVINAHYIKSRQIGLVLKDPVNLNALLIIFNCLIFGLCSYVPFRGLLEFLLPPLKGFDFSRFAFLNPFLWYTLTALIILRLIKVPDPENTIVSTGRKMGATALSLALLMVVMLWPQVYNDFYYTVYNQAYIAIKEKDTSTLNYREFYSEPLFDRLKQDVGIGEDDWCVAYGLHPGVLIYNGIPTLDGYLGMYPQEYKDIWCEIEEPAFAGSPSLKEYYTTRGARVCIYSGSDENTYAPLRKLELNDRSLKVNYEPLKALGLKYIISRVEFDNSYEYPLSPVGEYTDESSPYTIYVYEAK